MRRDLFLLDYYMSSTPSIPTASVRVLVADDHIDSADALSEVIQGLGYIVATAYNGAQALEVAGHFKPHIVVMDINMPVLDGLAAARAFKDGASPTDAPILIALTANSSIADRLLSLKAGFVHHAIKPLFLNDLQLLLEKYQELLPSKEIEQAGHLADKEPPSGTVLP